MPDILFLTFPEHGQANVHLATAFEIYSRRIPGVNVHVASAPNLKPRFDQVKARVDAIDSGARGSEATFHTVLQYSYAEAVKRGGHTEATYLHQPARRSSRHLDLIGFACPYPPQDYMACIDECQALMEKLAPVVVIIDALFSQAIDACKLAKQPYMIFSPLPGSATSMGNQPHGRALWYYPSMGTDIAFPIPWSDFFPNIINTFRLAYAVFTDPNIKATNAAREARGCTWMHPLFTTNNTKPDVPILSAGVPEVDFPFVAPPGLHMLGAVSVLCAPLAECDPDLEAWLNRGETIMMVRGSHIQYDAPLARRVLAGLLGGAGDRQILWKVHERDALTEIWDEMLTTQRDRERVRIVKWFEPEPAIIAEHENVVCYVHHGGANSYLEAARAGTPQVILPVWMDTYQDAMRLEYCGLGVYGSRSAAPDVDATELAVAVSTVVSGPKSVVYRRRAREVATRCRQGGGRVKAADLVLEQLEL
ncbi:glycosyltransferase family 1 protein [Schizophyllum amplum]|uniref:Glycosyltransferase family 1 protein n=1 Tax=Schizophyllum amplum TaxID=97359 RepID=A0A550CHV8_9AGAR|nr:glycosyltransferase family 1 protein [Auriculariopsis ampla]